MEVSRPGRGWSSCDVGATTDLDVTTTDMLFELVRELHGRSIEVLLAQVKGSVRDRMRRTGIMTEVTEDRVYLSIGSAVIDFHRRWPTGDATPTEDAGRPSDPGRQALPVESVSRSSAISARSMASSSTIASGARRRRGTGPVPGRPRPAPARLLRRRR